MAARSSRTCWWRRPVAPTVLVFLLLVWVVPSGASAQPAPATAGSDATEPAYASGLRALLEAEMQRADIPGVLVGVWSPTAGDWHAALGTADLSSGVPMQVDNHMRIGCCQRGRRSGHVGPGHRRRHAALALTWPPGGARPGRADRGQSGVPAGPRRGRPTGHSRVRVPDCERLQADHRRSHPAADQPRGDYRSTPACSPCYVTCRRQLTRSPTRVWTQSRSRTCCSTPGAEIAMPPAIHSICPWTARAGRGGRRPPCTIHDRPVLLCPGSVHGFWSNAIQTTCSQSKPADCTEA